MLGEEHIDSLDSLMQLATIYRKSRTLEGSGKATAEGTAEM